MIHSRLTMRSRAVLGAGVAHARPGRRLRHARRLVGAGEDEIGDAHARGRTGDDTLFWRTLHGGAYDQIPQSLTALKAAYLADPNDSVTAAHVGFMHIWRLARARADRIRPGPRDHRRRGARPQVLRGGGPPRSRRGALSRLLRLAPDDGGHDPQGRQARAARLLHDARGGGGVAGVQLLHRGLQRQRACRTTRRDSRKRSRPSG